MCFLIHIITLFCRLVTFFGLLKFCLSFSLLFLKFFLDFQKLFEILFLFFLCLVNDFLEFFLAFVFNLLSFLLLFFLLDFQQFQFINSKKVLTGFFMYFIFHVLVLMNFQVIAEGDWGWWILWLKGEILALLVVLFLFIECWEEDFSKGLCWLVFIGLSEVEHMVWDGIVSLCRDKVLDIFKFHELLLKLFGLFALEGHFLDEIGFFLRLHDELIVWGVLMRVFEVELDDVLKFLSLLVNGAFL